MSNDTPVEEQQYIDPNAPMHTRVIEQPINDQVFDFHWTRINASQLLYIIAGQKETPDDTAMDGMKRMLLKTVDSSQKGLLLDLLNDKANYTLSKKLVAGMLGLITSNETIIGSPDCSKQGDIKRFAVPLITDSKTEVFDFKTDRSGFDEFMQNKEDAASDTAEQVHNFLSDCLEDPKQKQRYNLLVFDERNFTLSVKLYSKVASFLARNQAITTKPTLKK
jgi:hypothetical protein